MPKTMKVNLEYLLQYKKSKNLTNKELADLIGVHESTISRILRGKKGIGSKVIIGFIRLDDIEINKLFSPNKKAS